MYLDVAGFEWRSSEEHGVEDDADGPDVHWVGIAICFVEDFGGQVVGRSAGGLPFFIVAEQLRSQAEVADLHVHGVRQQDVSFNKY